MSINQAMYEQTLRDGLMVFRDAIGGADVPLHTVLFFLAINEKTPPKVSDMGRLFPDLSSATLTRNCQILTASSKLRKDGGFALCEYVHDQTDRRVKYLHLTKFGKEIRERMFISGVRFLNEAIS
jgi:DNA-binding MarR family transcriptional regulator